jgi:D-sedoheptulose 7-phosphate isomerase
MSQTVVSPAASLQRAIAEHIQVFRNLESLQPLIDEAAAQMIDCLRSGGKVCWMGNGGSAADSQHLAAELVGRFTRERRGLASIALTTDSSILTCIGNDYGYDAVFARQVEALCRPGDVLVGITTSGNSPNVVAAMRRAREVGGIFRIGMTGESGGALSDESELLLAVPAAVTARVQEAHIFLGHHLCDLVEASFAAEERN